MDDDDSNDDVVLVNPTEQGLQEEEKGKDAHSPGEIEISPPHSDISLSPAQQSSSDCIIIDSELDQITAVTPGQYDDAPEEEEEEEKKDDMNVGQYSSISDSEGYDSNALCCICQQKHNKRFMICCDSCQEWFHGNCVGIGETEGHKMEKKGQEYICATCTAKKQLQPEPHPHPQPELSFPECLTLSPGEKEQGHEQQPALKESVVVVEEKEDEEAPVMRPEPELEAKMETDSSLPLCIGPGCSRQALPDSVYCGPECILQHAAFTMQTLSVPKVPKARGRPQRKAASARPAAKGPKSARMSKRLAGKAEGGGEDQEEKKKEDDGGQKEAASPSACDPSLTEVQATSIPASNFYTASKKDNKQVEADIEAVTPSKQSPEDTATDAAPSSQPVAEPALPQSHTQEKPKEPVNSGMSKQQPAESNPLIPPNPAKSSLSPPKQSPSTSAPRQRETGALVVTNPAKSSPSRATQPPSTSGPRHHETGALMVTKTTYVIPKKQSGPKPPSSHVSASASSQKPSAGPTLLNETRNLPVPPAPSAPSSRPSQPNNQVRQSIQRSLTSILFKRVCDCEDLEMSESEVAKLVASIEMEMFDIFRNTDSKYMNKYRTIMFNLKDPRNKGLLYRVVRGEIGPFRLVRMSQKDMQAIKASEPSAKETMEVKDPAAKATRLLQKPEAVKVELPILNPPRPDRRMEQKISLPAPAPAPASAPAPKTRMSQPSQSSAVPDILACMLKDTTSEHKAHLFDLKCKICTGQIPAGDQEEPAKKKPKVSETRDKYESSWRKSAGDDSPLRAPPDSPDMDSPTSCLDPSSRLIIDSPVLTIVESPASPIMDSPASPTLESPASPIMESPASPTPDTPKATTTKRAYTPVVIPAVSTVTITRRDPRTAASRFSASSGGTSVPSKTTHNQSTPYAPLKETRSASPSAPATSLPQTLPKSILMKPSSSADTRLYGTSSRTVISESPADGETADFLAKQDIVWKGFLNMLTVAKFVTKGYLVSGSAESLKADLPDTIQIGGRIMPQTVWDYVAKLKTSVTKELCVIRFHPATEEEEVAYVSLFSYFSSRGRFGVVANSSRSIKDLYLVPLSAKESIPSILQPLEGPGLEKTRPNLLLGLAIIQKAKRPGGLPQEIEEKRPKVHMSKDPMWIPKPPVLYGSDKLEIFQPYDPETPMNTTPPGSPSCPGSPSESSSSGSVTIPSLLTSIRENHPVSTSATIAATQSTSNSISDKNPTTASSDKTPLQTILKSLFGSKQTDHMASTDGSSATTTVSAKKPPVFSQVSGSMVDPIVQQYGQKSKVKEIEEEENDFDRPYDPEEEYDPAMGYGMVAPQSIENIKADGPAVSGFVDDDVAYDPEDETIFEDMQSDIVTKAPAPTQMSDSLSCPAPVSTQAVTPAPTTTPVETSSPVGITQNLPTGTVVVSAATLTEQQRMLEELNKQIEEQKRQLKEQEEALRQQREAVGMFMAHFSVSDSLMSPPQKSLPLNQLSSMQSGITQTETRPSESTDKTNNLTETVDSLNVDSQTVKQVDETVTPNLKNNTDTATEQDETQENVKESDKYSSAGEIEDSDVAYDPEDESLFNEIQEDVFQGGNIKSRDSSMSRSGRSASHKGSPLNSYHSRKRRLSPKRRSHRERDHHRSPSRKSQRHSPSHSQRRRERDRHRRTERDRSRHRARDHSERQGRHRKEHAARRHSRGRRRSPSSPRKKDSVSLSPKRPSPQALEKTSTSVTIKNDPDGHQLKCNLDENPDKDFPLCSHELLHNVKLEISEKSASQELHKKSVSDHDDTSRNSSTQVDEPSQQETLLINKLDSTVPLREIDPPIRDSPQSPDPEPQFVKPSSIDKSDYVKTEEIRDDETYTSVSVPHVKVENNSLPIGGQAIVSNIVWPTVGGPGIRDKGMIETGKQIKGEGQVLPHPNPATGSDILRSGHDIDPMTAGTESGTSGPGIRNPGSDINEPEHMGPQIYPRETGIRCPGPDMRGPLMQGTRSSTWVPGPNVQELAVSSQGKNARDAGTGMQGSEPNIRKAGIQHTDRTGTGSDVRGSGVRGPVQDTESSSFQSVDPEVKGPGSDVTHKESEMRGKMLVPVVTNPQREVSGLQNERRDGPGPEISGSGSREPLSAMYHSSPDTRRPVVVDEGRDGGCLPKDLLSFKTEEHRSQPESPNGRPGVMEIGRGWSFRGPPIEGRAPGNIGRGRGQKDRGESPHTQGMRSAMRDGGVKDRSPDIRSPGPLFRGSGRIQRHSRHDGSPVLEERGPWKSGFQPHGKDADFSRVGRGRERNLDLNVSVASEGSVDKLSPAMTDERWGPQSGQDVPMRRPGPNLNYESGGSNMLRIGQESSGPREHFKEPQPDFRAERSECGPDMRESGTMTRLRRSDVTERSYIQPGQDMCSMGGSDTWGERSEAHARNSGGDIGETGPNRRDIDIQGRNIQGPWPEKRIEQMNQEDRAPMPNITNPDWSGPGFVGPDMRSQMSQNKGLGPHMKDPGLGSGIKDDWGGPDRRGSGPVREGPFIQDECRLRQPDRRGPNVEDLRHGRRGPEGPDFMTPGPFKKGPDIEVPMHERRGPGGPGFMGPGPERRGSDIEIPVHDRRGLGGPDFRRTESERRGPTNDNLGPGMREPAGPGFESRGLSLDGPGPNRRGPAGPDFRGPWPERRGPDMVGPGPDMRGPGDQDAWGPGSERSGPAMEGSGTDRQGLGDADFSEPGPERRGFFVEGPGHARRGPGGPDFRGPGPERRGPAMEGPGTDRRRPVGLDFRGPGNEIRGLSMEGSRPDRRGPGGPDFRGPGPERRSLSMERPGPDSRRPGGPDFRGPGPERRSLPMDHPGPGSRGPGCPDFRGPGPERRGPAMEAPGPDRKGLGGPDFSGPRPDRGGPAMEAPGPDRRGTGGADFSGPGPDRRGPAMGGPGPVRRESGVPEFNGPGHERRGPSLQGHGSDRRGPGGQNSGGLGPDRRGPNMRGPGPDFMGLGPEQPGPGMEGPGPHSRGQGGPHLWGLGPESEPANMEGPGPNKRGPGGPNMRGPGPQHSHPNMDPPMPDRRGPEGPNFRGPGPERRPPDMDGNGNRRGFPGGPQFRGPEPGRRLPDVEGPESDRRGPHFRGVRPERTVMMDGPGPDRKGPRGPDFRGPGCESRWPDAEVPEPDSQEPEGSGYREPGPGRRGPGMEGPGPNWRRSGGPDFRGSFIKHKGPNTEGLRHRGSDWGGADFGGSEESPDTEGPGPDRTGQNLRGPGPMRRNIRGPGPDMSSLNQGERWKVPDPDMVCQEPTRGAPENEWKEPDRGGVGPNRWGPGPFFRGGREPDNRGQGNDRRGSGMRGPGSDMRGGPDMGNDWRQPNFRGNMRGPNMEGPGPHRGGPDLMNSCPNRRGFEAEGMDRRGTGGPGLRRPGHENRNSNIEGLGTERRFSDCRGSGSEKQGIDIESSGADRQGFDDFRRERRGPDMGSSDIRHGPGRWDTNTECPGLDSRGSEPASPHFNSPHQAARFQGPSDPHSAPHSRPLGPAQNTGLDNLQNQQAVKPPRHRGALLPTPTEGLIRFPNRIINPDGFSPKQKQTGHLMDREWNRGRPVSRERELVKGQRQEQEKSPASKTSTHGDEEKKKEGKETDN